MSKLVEINPEYIYITIPAEYICVYHKILAMLADFGEEMLKDCKANCTDKNSGVIECFNMFNAAVAARKLGKDKLASTLITYIKAKINNIYKDNTNNPSFVFPIDETGRLKAFVSCGENIKYQINPDDGMLYEHLYTKGISEHFLPSIEEGIDNNKNELTNVELEIIFKPYYEINDDDTISPCANLNIYWDGKELTKDELNKCIIEYYFDNIEINHWKDIKLSDDDLNHSHNFKIIVMFNNKYIINNKDLKYERTN